VREKNGYPHRDKIGRAREKGERLPPGRNAIAKRLMSSHLKGPGNGSGLPVFIEERGGSAQINMSSRRPEGLQDSFCKKRPAPRVLLSISWGGKKDTCEKDRRVALDGEPEKKISESL